MRHGTLPLTHWRWQLTGAGLILAAALIYGLFTIRMSNSGAETEPATHPIHVAFIRLAAPVNTLHMVTRGTLVRKDFDSNIAHIRFSLPLQHNRLLTSIIHARLQGIDPAQISQTIQRLNNTTGPLMNFLASFSLAELPADWIVGMPMQLELQGTLKSPLMPIDYSHLRANNRVWLIDDQQRLVMQPVHIAYQDDKYLYIDHGLKTGDRLITSPLAFASQGLPLDPVLQANAR